MAWVNGVSTFSKRFPPSFRISQDRGEGMIAHGTRQWTDYEVKSDIVIHLGNYGGVALRVQGLRRYYGVRVTRGRLAADRARARRRDEGAGRDRPSRSRSRRSSSFSARAEGNAISATVDGVSLSAEDNDAGRVRRRRHRADHPRGRAVDGRGDRVGMSLVITLTGVDRVAKQGIRG